MIVSQKHHRKKFLFYAFLCCLLFIGGIAQRHDKGWTNLAVGTQLSKVSEHMADGPSQYWNPYTMEKKGDKLFATLPTVNELKQMDF